jgi:hypothetical protein
MDCDTQQIPIVSLGKMQQIPIVSPIKVIHDKTVAARFVQFNYLLVRVKIFQMLKLRLSL